MTRCVIFILAVLAGAVNVPAQFRMRGPSMDQRLWVLKTRVKPLYRRPTNSELKAVEPSSALLESYAEFLRQPNTGLTKLISDKGCGHDAKVVSASEDCLKYSLPGGGSSFSFRTENYSLPRLADITFTEKSFQASGILVLGIFVKLGDVPITDVDLQTKGMKYLLELQPDADYSRAKTFSEQIKDGVLVDGFLYRRGLYTADNTTYALRSVAYSGKYFRAAAGVTYNEFDFDKRKDVVVVFRIVERDTEGNVTILWKKLRENASPKVNWKTSDSTKNQRSS